MRNPNYDNPVYQEEQQGRFIQVWKASVTEMVPYTIGLYASTVRVRTDFIFKGAGGQPGIAPLQTKGELVHGEVYKVWP
jgi:hypothetical protein